MLPLTWNADREELPNGQQRTRARLKWCNYLGLDGWNKIDLSPVQAGGLFSVNKAPYSVEIPTKANDWSILQSTNRYDIWQRKEMPDAPVGIQKRYPDALPVDGQITRLGVLFVGAFPGLNADRLVRFHEQRISDEIVFRSAPPGTGDVIVPLEIDFGQLPILLSQGIGKLAVEADFRSDGEVLHGLSFTTGAFRGLKIKSPRAWDSRGRSAAIKLRGKVIGNRWVGMKVIPRSFFMGAAYPVYADTTSTFYPDPHTESTSVDGQVSNDATESAWAALHDAADGTSFNDSSATFQPALSGDATTDTWASITRCFLLFDTSSIPDTDTVTAGTVSVYVLTKEDNYNQKLNLVSSNPASSTALSTADFDQLGTSAFATQIDITGMATSAYEVFTLNGSGLAAVSINGVTKFGLRLDSDLNNTPPTWVASVSAALNISSAEETGTAQDPYLEVVHSVVAASGFKGMLLLGCGA